MRIIEIEALENGAHRNQNSPLTAVPDGWAVIPDGMAVPDTFPFVGFETAEIDGVATVTSMTAGTFPEPAEDAETE